MSAIRNFVKYVYNTVEGEDKLKYLCLFGDASFDYKDKVANNTNVFPIWTSRNSYSLTISNYRRLLYFNG